MSVIHEGYCLYGENDKVGEPFPCLCDAVTVSAPLPTPCWCCKKIGGYHCFYCAPVRLPRKPHW